jgi:hypothetical protein
MAGCYQSRASTGSASPRWAGTRFSLLNHDRHVDESRHVLERVAVEDDEIGELARLERAGLVIKTEKDGRGAVSIVMTSDGENTRRRVSISWTTNSDRLFSSAEDSVSRGLRRKLGYSD